MSMLMNSVSLGCSLALVKLHIHMTVSLCVAIVHKTQGMCWKCFRLAFQQALTGLTLLTSMIVQKS